MYVSGQLHGPSHFTTQKGTSVMHWVRGWVGPDPVWTQWRGEIIPDPDGIITSVVQPVS